MVCSFSTSSIVTRSEITTTVAHAVVSISRHPGCKDCCASQGHVKCETHGWFLIVPGKATNAKRSIRSVRRK